MPKSFEKKTMKAVRINPSADVDHPYGAETHPPSSAITLVDDLRIPDMSESGDMIVQVKATTAIRDNLTWPELFKDDHAAQMGNDFAGIVVAVFDGTSGFQVDDEVYGMTSASRGGTWAEYALVRREEASHKPKNLSWEEAAALPLSALTADQALFRHAQLDTETHEPKRVLITGAAGAVGTLLIQFAQAAGHCVIGATSSNDRNAHFLEEFGPNETIEYTEMGQLEPCDVVIDTVGGDILRDCWGATKSNGVLVSIESSSWDFARNHRAEGLDEKKEDIRALFFIVEPSGISMKRISKAAEAGKIKGSVLQALPFEKAREAYELCHRRHIGRGKVVLVM